MSTSLLDEAKATFLVGDCVDFDKITATLAVAITEEMEPIPEAQIYAIWQSVIEPEDHKFIVYQNGKTLIGIPLLFQRYASFMSALGEGLGVALGEDMMGDDWISPDMPKTRDIASALMRITVEYLSRASEEMKAKTGTSPADVLVQALSTGESYEQSHTRLIHAARGLQVVKGKN